MTAVFNLFAYERGHDEDRHVRRERMPRWKLGYAIQWALDQGYDSILIESTVGEPNSTPILTHHICNDPDCPGGC